METRNYSVDIIMQAIARIFGGLISFVAIFMLTYLFSESDLGEYNLILSTVNIIASLGTLWLSQSVLRFYEERTDLGAIIILTIVSAAISVFAYGIFNMFAQQVTSFWAFAYILILVLYNVFDAVFRRTRHLKKYVAMELLLAISRVFPMVVIAKTTKDYNSIFASQCLVLLIFFIVLIFGNITSLKNASYKVNNKMLSQYLRFGIPLMGLAVSNWFLTTSDRYIIKLFGNNTEVGIYSTNYSLANSIYMMFSLVVVNAFHPIIMKEWSKDKENTLHLVSSAIDLYLMMMVPLTFYGCLKADLLLSLFKGDLYASHPWIFRWTALGIFFYGLSLLFHKYYELTKKTNIILIINIIAAVSNIIMNFLMIPKMGFGVASFTTFVSYIIYIVIVILLTYKNFRLHINFKKAVIVFGATGLFFVFDYLLVKNNTIISFFIEGIIYVLYTAVIYQIFKIIDFRNYRLWRKPL